MLNYPKKYVLWHLNIGEFIATINRHKREKNPSNMCVDLYQSLTKCFKKKKNTKFFYFYSIASGSDPDTVNIIAE